MQQLRVVMVISSFSPIIGGAERQALQLGQSLAARGVRVQVLTRRYPALAAREQIGQVSVHRMPVVGDGRNPLSTFLFLSGVVQWLIRNRDCYDVVHAHQTLSPATAALLAKLWTGKPVLVKVAGSGYYGGLTVMRRRPLTSWRVRLLRHTDRFLVLNQESQQELRQFGIVDKQMAPIFNGVDTAYFKPISQKATSQSLKVVYVGRLSVEKGVDVLLRAWAQVEEARASKSAELILVGDGAERASLEALRTTLNLHYVTFVGQSRDVQSYLQKADLFVLPSRTEGLPNALLEAMASGLPTVATSAGAVPDVVLDGETGLLVPPEDVLALGAAISRLLADPDLRRRMGQKSRQRVQAHYSLDAATTRHLQLYREVIGNDD